MKPKNRSRLINLLMKLTDAEALEALSQAFQRIDDKKSSEELLDKFSEVEHETQT